MRSPPIPAQPSRLPVLPDDCVGVVAQVDHIVRRVEAVEVLSYGSVQLPIQQLVSQLLWHRVESRNDAGVFGQHVRIVHDGRVDVIPLEGVILQPPVIRLLWVRCRTTNRRPDAPVPVSLRALRLAVGLLEHESVVVFAPVRANGIRRTHHAGNGPVAVRIGCALRIDAVTRLEEVPHAQRYAAALIEEDDWEG